jgi:hypothetical protein
MNQPSWLLGFSVSHHWLLGFSVSQHWLLGFSVSYHWLLLLAEKQTIQARALATGLGCTQQAQAVNFVHEVGSFGHRVSCTNNCGCQ